ncbi:hypothetical protein [Advenella kashmirensis]|uniref:hypothetical protein n=1 Tax=Advenella kashmirensis TaxID=310575 RepID=UPI0011D1DDB0|nr:hypothetical protein [Advenella kashmirensis]
MITVLVSLLIPVRFPLAALHGSQQGDCVADFVQDRIEHIAVEMMAVHSNTPLQEKYTDSSCCGEKRKYSVETSHRIYSKLHARFLQQPSASISELSVKKRPILVQTLGKRPNSWRNAPCCHINGARIGACIRFSPHGAMTVVLALVIV